MSTSASIRAVPSPASLRVAGLNVATAHRAVDGSAVTALAWMYCAAAVLGVISVVAPHHPGVEVPQELVLSGIALATGAGLRLAGSRLPPRAFSALVLLGTVLVTFGIHFSAGVPNAASLFYLWIALYAFYFFSRREALVHMAAVAAGYALVIALQPPPFPAVAHWTTTVATLLGAGLLVGVLRDRLNAVIERLADAARTDPLTGLLNRRGFHEVAELELERAKRTSRPVSLVIGDLDGFKRVNDLHGHSAGDQVLRQLAAVVNEHLRRSDTVARYGGEEFALLLPETGRAEAVQAADRLRRALVGELRSGHLSLSASFGVATFPEDGPTLEGLLQRSDEALYAAKAQGRNRVVACPSPQPGAARSPRRLTR